MLEDVQSERAFAGWYRLEWWAPSRPQRTLFLACIAGALLASLACGVIYFNTKLGLGDSRSWVEIGTLRLNRRFALFYTAFFKLRCRSCRHSRNTPFHQAFRLRRQGGLRSAVGNLNWPRILVVNGIIVSISVMAGYIGLRSISDRKSARPIRKADTQRLFTLSPKLATTLMAIQHFRKCWMLNCGSHSRTSGISSRTGTSPCGSTTGAHLSTGGQFPYQQPGLPFPKKLHRRPSWVRVPYCHPGGLNDRFHDDEFPMGRPRGRPVKRRPGFSGRLGERSVKVFNIGQPGAGFPQFASNYRIRQSCSIPTW